MSLCLFVYNQSLRHQCEGPHRSASRFFAPGIASGKNTAESRRNRHVLATFVSVSNRCRIDARAGFELPKCLSRVLVKSNELTGQLAREHKATTGRKHT